MRYNVPTDRPILVVRAAFPVGVMIQNPSASQVVISTQRELLMDTSLGEHGIITGTLPIVLPRFTGELWARATAGAAQLDVEIWPLECTPPPAAAGPVRCGERRK